MNAYKQILVDIARAIVDEPDSVSVDTTEDEDGTLVLVLSVAPDDMGKVIGKHGRIAKAIRSVIRAAANRGGDRVAVEIR
ncbi:MAG: KH domain-containing protein [Clostridia bacterium]|nr:KH domain-containing protein [Clostridia bacterium]